MDGTLIDAGALHFGPLARVGGMAFLESLDPAAVRRAYRRIAVASHPDAARRGGARRDTVDGRRFIETSRAYELLMGWVLLRKGAQPPSRAARPRAPQGQRPAPAGRKPAAGKAAGGKSAGARTAGAKQAGTEEKKRARPATAARKGTPLFYRGAIPRRKLRLAEYLYFSGRVSWQSMINAIVWQRAARPKFGEIARELSRISAEELWNILGSKLRHEQTGETAQRLRILSAAEVERILRLQRARHKPIGRYFVEEERMSGPVLTGLLRELYRHNARRGRAT